MNKDEVVYFLLALLIVIPLWLVVYGLFLPLIVLGISSLLNLGLTYSHALGVSIIMWLIRAVLTD